MSDASAGGSSPDGSGAGVASTAHAITDAGEGAPDELLSRLRVIEQQPLGDRAGAYAAVHDELSATLEGGDAPSR